LRNFIKLGQNQTLASLKTFNLLRLWETLQLLQHSASSGVTDGGQLPPVLKQTFRPK